MVQLSKLPMFFLGAMSRDGFASDFSNVYDAYAGWTAYILKGGPGTGKSTVMKSVATEGVRRKEKVLLCPCSSDPNSLDGVILPDKKCVVLDGTAPHVVEPKYPIICEQIINLGECIDADKLRGDSAKIIELCQEKAAYMGRAKRYITAAAELLEDSYKIEMGCVDVQKAERTAYGLAKEYITKKQKGAAKRTLCRLRAVTPLGMMYYKNTPQKLCDNTIIIADEHGAASNRILSVIESTALKNGYDVITAVDPIFPDSRIDAVMIPGLQVAFCVENRYMHPQSENRRIHLRRFCDNKALQEHKLRLNFNKKTADEMFKEAAISLSLAAKTHSQIEKFYVNSCDFAKVAEKSAALISSIFSKK